MHKKTIGSPQCERCVGHLEYAGVEDDHDETGDVEGTEGGVDDELRVVETTEVHLYHSHLIKATIMSRMMVMVVMMKLPPRMEFFLLAPYVNPMGLVLKRTFFGSGGYEEGDDDLLNEALISSIRPLVEPKHDWETCTKQPFTISCPTSAFENQKMHKMQSQPSLTPILCVFSVHLNFFFCELRMNDSPIAREEAQHMEMVTYAGDECYQEVGSTMIFMFWFPAEATF